MIRDYIVGQTETLTLVPIGQADGSNQFIKVDGVLVNGFSDLTLYTDAAGSSPVPGGDYSETTIDVQWTADEAQAGGTGKTVHSQFQVTNATYQGIDLWATITNFGTYTSNDAAFDQVGGEQTISSGGTLVLQEGYTQEKIIYDTSLGGFTINIPDGDFDGQVVISHNAAAGTGLVYEKGSGIYDGASATGTPLSPGKSIRRTWCASLGVWTYEDVVTADYVSGGMNVLQKSYGFVDFYEVRAISFSASTGSGNITYTLPISVVSVERIPTPTIEGYASSHNIVGGLSTAIVPNIIFIFFDTLNTPRTGTFFSRVSIGGIY